MNSNYPKACSVFYCGKENCLNGHSYGPKIRNHYLLHYIVSGKGVYEVANSKFNLSAGDMFLIKPKEVTYYYADSVEPWSYMWVAFDGYEVQKILQDCGFGYVKSVKNAEEFLENIEKIVEEYFSKNRNEYKILACFYDMMSKIVEFNMDINHTYDKTYFDIADKFMTNNYVYPITIENVSNHVGIERSYLYKIFMKNIKISPKKHLNNIRIKAAVNLLMNSDIPVSQIALSCGFADSSSFCKQFKKEYNLNPLAYKKQINGYIGAE